MILVDQFLHNIYRHTIYICPGDVCACSVVDAGHDWLSTLVPEVECLLVPCLILTHQENLSDQKACLEIYERLEPRLPPNLPFNIPRVSPDH